MLATLPNIQPALTLDQADLYASRVRGSLSEDEWRDYQIRCATERRAPITYGATAIAQGVGTNGRLDRNTLATRWHGIPVTDSWRRAGLSKVDDPDLPRPAVVIGAPSNAVEPLEPVRATGAHRASPPSPTSTSKLKNAPWAPDAVITLLAAANPKRPGTSAHIRFGYYQTGITVAGFLTAGGTVADLKWDSERKFIKIG